jgi:hypothetical protein
MKPAHRALLIETTRPGGDARPFLSSRSVMRQSVHRSSLSRIARTRLTIKHPFHVSVLLNSRAARRDIVAFGTIVFRKATSLGSTVADLHYRQMCGSVSLGRDNSNFLTLEVTMKKIALTLACVLTAASLAACAGKAPVGKGKGKAPVAPVSAPIAVRG